MRETCVGVHFKKYIFFSRHTSWALWGRTTSSTSMYTIEMLNFCNPTRNDVELNDFGALSLLFHQHFLILPCLAPPLTLSGKKSQKVFQSPPAVKRHQESFLWHRKGLSPMGTCLREHSQEPCLLQTCFPSNKWNFRLYKIWLVVLTILKIWKSMGRINPYIMEHKNHDWNHQPEMMRLCTFFMVTENLGIPLTGRRFSTQWAISVTRSISPLEGAPSTTETQQFNDIWKLFISIWEVYLMLKHPNIRIPVRISESPIPGNFPYAFLNWKPTSRHGHPGELVIVQTARPNFCHSCFLENLKPKMCSLLNRIYWRISTQKKHEMTTCQLDPSKRDFLPPTIPFITIFVLAPGKSNHQQLAATWVHGHPW